MSSVVNYVGGAIASTVSAVGSGIDWTLRTSGGAVIYTLGTAGTIVEKTTAGVAVAVGYPTAVIAATVAVSSGIFAIGPCIAYANLPDANTWAGKVEIVLSPANTTVNLIDAALCPYSAHACITATAVAAVAYTVARWGRRSF